MRVSHCDDGPGVQQVPPQAFLTAGFLVTLDFSFGEAQFLDTVFIALTAQLTVVVFFPH